MAGNYVTPMKSDFAGKQSDLGHEDNFIRDQVMELYRWSKLEHEQRYCTDWFFYYRHYMNYVDRRVSSDDYKSNIGVGLAFPIIELIHAHMMSPWMDRDELIKAIAEEELGADRAPNVSAYINNILMNRVERSYSKHSLVKKSGLIFGRGIAKPYIRYERPISVLRRIPKMIFGMRVGSAPEWTDTPPMRRIDIDYVDPFNWWKTPGSRFMHDAEWTFEQSYLTTSQAYARVESGEWRDRVLDDNSAMGYDEWAMKRLSLEQGGTDQVHASYASAGGGRARQPHRIVEFQGRIEVKESRGSRPKYQDMLIVIGDEDWIAKKARLSTWNSRPGYILWEPTLNPGADRPIGVIEPMEDILLELNDYENIALDNARKILESPLLVEPRSMKQDKLYLGPGEINWVKNPRNSVVPLEMKDLPSSFYHQIGFLNDLVQRISGVSDYFGGMNTADSSRMTKTASGMQLMANMAASRFGPLITSLDHDFYRKEAQWIHETAKLWMIEPESMRLPGNPSSPFTSIGPDDMDVMLQYNYNTRAINPQGDKKRQQFIDMVKMIGEMNPFLAQQGYQLDYYEVVKLLMDEFDRGNEVNKLIKQIGQSAMAGAPATGPMNPLGQIMGGGIPGMLNQPPTFVPPSPRMAA
jgi:hypothetical protein